MLQWIFGPVKNLDVKIKTKDTNAGLIELQKARVKWFLSINQENLPLEVKQKGLTTYRSLSIEGQELEFSKGFTDLHTVNYQEIIENRGYGLVEAKESIKITSSIRNFRIQKNK